MSQSASSKADLDEKAHVFLTIDNNQMTRRAPPPPSLEPETQLLRAAGLLQDAIRRRRSSCTTTTVDDESDSEKENCTRVSNSGRHHHDDCEQQSVSMSEWERRGLLRMSELSLSQRLSKNDAPASADASIGELTRRALDWMQRDTEQLARETRATQELLFSVVATINGVFAQELQSMAGDGAAEYPLIDKAQDWEELSIERVEKLVGEWEAVLLEWRMRGLDVESQRRERDLLCREECDAQLQQLRESHAVERGIVTRLVSCVMCCLLSALV